MWDGEPEPMFTDGSFIEGVSVDALDGWSRASFESPLACVLVQCW